MIDQMTRNLVLSNVLNRKFLHHQSTKHKFVFGLYSQHVITISSPKINFACSSVTCGSINALNFSYMIYCRTLLECDDITPMFICGLDILQRSLF